MGKGSWGKKDVIITHTWKGGWREEGTYLRSFSGHTSRKHLKSSSDPPASCKGSTSQRSSSLLSKSLCVPGCAECQCLPQIPLRVLPCFFSHSSYFLFELTSKDSVGTNNSHRIFLQYIASHAVSLLKTPTGLLEPTGENLDSSAWSAGPPQPVPTSVGQTYHSLQGLKLAPRPNYTLRGHTSCVPLAL